MSCTLAQGEQQGECIARVDRIVLVMSLCSEASGVLEALESSSVPRYEQMDLLSPPSSDEAISFWRSVVRACGAEYQRLVPLFFRRCPHDWEPDSAISDPFCREGWGGAQ